MKTFYFIGVSEETEAKVQDKQVNTRRKNCPIKQRGAEDANYELKFKQSKALEFSFLILYISLNQRSGLSFNSFYY
jgi:hypothetical protein